MQLQIFSPVKHSDLTSQILGICIKVHKVLGPGLLESVYERAICFELAKAGLSFKRQQGIKVFYEGEDMNLGFRADVIIENTVLLEIKSVESVTPVFKKTCLTYLRFTELEVGLIVNFNVLRLMDGVTRLVLDKREEPSQ